VACLLATVLAVGAPDPAATASATTDDSSGDSSGGPSSPPVTANEFIPEDRDLSECISALPKPDCGSDARGGWRQGLVLALVLAGMVGIGLRIAMAIRRRDAAIAAQLGTVDEHGGSVSRP
jgi:hypothetical protein